MFFSSHGACEACGVNEAGAGEADEVRGVDGASESTPPFGVSPLVHLDDASLHAPPFGVFLRAPYASSPPVHPPS